MKRKIAALLTLVFIFTLMLPLQGFAAEMDKELENAIKTVKSKFSIPEDYKFTSSISTSQTHKVYYLNWRSNDTVNMSSIDASVDDKGMILSYNKYTPYDYKQTKKIPALSRKEAMAKADAYIEHIAPGLTKQIRNGDNGQDSILDSSYYLYYYRVIDDVPYYNNNVSVTINRETGELQGYYRNWSSELEFPATEGAISLEKAEDAYAGKLGFRLIYSYTMQDDAIKAFPLYAPVYDNNSFVIDAFTGEKYRLMSGMYAFDTNGYGMQNARKEVTMAAGVDVRLSPEELKAVEDAAKLMDIEEAQRLARKAEFIDITDDYELQSYDLSTNWPDNKEYIWSLFFRKPSEDTTKSDKYISVSLNAKTGVITQFYKNTEDNSDKKPVDDIVKAKAVTDKFLADYYPQYRKLLEYDSVSNEEYMADKTVPESYYNIVYTRLVNGIHFPDNGAYISYDNLTGEIISFSLIWFEIDFPSVDKVIDMDTAVDSLFEEVGLGLEYRFGYPDEKAQIRTREGQIEGKTVLVYMFKPGKPLYIDAVSGNLVYKSGEEYKEVKQIEYTDIEGHYAQRQISVLAEFGIALDGSEFRPLEDITQKDFLTYLSKTLSYYGPIINERSSQKDVDELYTFMIREGIITEAEKSPDRSVTREEAVKYIIRALKYDKVADIKGIFNISFKDNSSISEDLYGYVAIASGLGIVKGDGSNFYPKRNITRGESAIIIYNYLQQ